MPITDQQLDRKASSFFSFSFTPLWLKDGSRFLLQISVIIEAVYDCAWACESFHYAIEHIATE